MLLLFGTCYSAVSLLCCWTLGPVSRHACCKEALSLGQTCIEVRLSLTSGGLALDMTAACMLRHFVSSALGRGSCPWAVNNHR